ncbi:YdcF family protein, partial [Vibrio sp. 10N.222.55.E8]
PYPYQSTQGELFLLVDALTTYRVYLEGVSTGAFERDLESVRQKPEQLSLDALNIAKELVRGSSNFVLMDSLLPVLDRCIQQTSA